MPSPPPRPPRPPIGMQASFQAHVSAPWHPSLDSCRSSNARQVEPFPRKGRHRSVRPWNGSPRGPIPSANTRVSPAVDDQTRSAVRCGVILNLRSDDHGTDDRVPMLLAAFGDAETAFHLLENDVVLADLAAHGGVTPVPAGIGLSTRCGESRTTSSSSTSDPTTCAGAAPPPKALPRASSRPAARISSGPTASGAAHQAAARRTGLGSPHRPSPHAPRFPPAQLGGPELPVETKSSDAIAAPRCCCDCRSRAPPQTPSRTRKSASLGTNRPAEVRHGLARLRRLTGC